MPEWLRLSFIPRQVANIQACRRVHAAGGVVFSDAEKRRAYRDGALPRPMGSTTGKCGLVRPCTCSAEMHIVSHRFRCPRAHVDSREGSG